VVCDLYRLDQFVTPSEAGLKSSVADEFKRRCLGKRGRDVRRFVIDKNPIAVDPSSLDVVHIVVYDESINRMDQLPIPNVRKEVRLHDGKLHGSRKY
jgi:hypothetical protein